MSGRWWLQLERQVKTRAKDGPWMIAGADETKLNLELGEMARLQRTSGRSKLRCGALGGECSGMETT